MVQKTLLGALCSTVAIVAIASPTAAHAQATANLNLPAQDLGKSLRAVAQATNSNIVFDPADTSGKRAPAIKGQYSAGDAVRNLLDGSGLSARSTGSGSWVVSKAGNALAGGPDAGTESASSLGEEGVSPGQEGIAEILVVGTRSQNADIRRTEDDPQPYVVITGEEVRHSGVTNLEDFFRSRLPMNTQRGSTNLGNNAVNNGGITLRGLTQTQTLILVDGRRLPNVGISGPTGAAQPNINGIPTSAIERIEVLPATAGGIYGGGAVGGVINIILRRDYTGVDVEAIYGNAFDAAAGYASFSLNGGFSLEHGRTSVTLSASASRQAELHWSDRDFQRSGRELNWINRPADFINFPPLSYTPNICSTIGASTSCIASAPNLVLDDSDGAGPLVGAALNSRYTYVPNGYAGPAGDGGSAFVQKAGRLNFKSARNIGTIYSGPELQAYSLSARRRFNDIFEGFIDLGFDRTRTTDTLANTTEINLPAGDPGNPFQQDIAVGLAFPESTIDSIRKVKNLRARGGVIARLPGGWTSSIEHNWSKNTNSLGRDGMLDFSTIAPYLRSIALRDPNTYVPDPIAAGAGIKTELSGPFATKLNNTILRASGPTIRLPGGRLTLSGYIEHRKEDVAASIFESILKTPSTTSSTLTWFAPKSQVARSAYLEARVPIVSPSLQMPLVHKLELLGAVRRDKYKTTTSPQGSGAIIPSREGPFPTISKITNEVKSTDYTVGISFSPIKDLALRASFGTAFLPPNTSQISPTINPSFPGFAFRDPKRGNTRLPNPITAITGGDPSLSPEQSKSISAGMIFIPQFASGLRMSVDFTRIKKTDEIFAIPGAVNGLLEREDEFPDRVVRGPLSDFDRDVLGYTAGPISQINLSVLNLANTSVKAWDFQVNYDWQTKRFGSFTPYLIATLQTELIRQVLVTDPHINSVGFLNGPLKWRGNFGVDWAMGSWSAGWAGQYYHSYRVCNFSDSVATCAPKNEAQGSAKIPNQMYHDLYVSYAFGDAEPVFKKLEVRLSIQNILNKTPPDLATIAGSGFDLYADPRLRRFLLTLRKHFGK